MVQKWLPRPRLLIVSSRGLFFSLSCLPASECPPRDFCKSLLFSTAELSQGQQRFHECLRVAAGYIERWHSASWPALLVQLGTEVACNDLAPSLPSMKTDTLGKQDRCCGSLLWIRWKSVLSFPPSLFSSLSPLNYHPADLGFQLYWALPRSCHLTEVLL